MKREVPAVLKIAVLLLLLIVLSLILTVALPAPADASLLKLRAMLAEDGHIIHAGGYLTASDGTEVSYTNSLEAMENLYRNGNRFCEIDLQETSDGMLICGHGDGEELVFGTGLPPTAEGKEFLAGRIYGEFTPLSADGLADFMNNHPDLYVITDVKSDNVGVCRILAEKYPNLRDRFIVQIQLPEEYDVLKELGFPYIMYPIFKTPDEQRGLLQLADFSKHHQLVALILPNGYYAPDAKLLMAEKLIGTPIVLHTLNDDWEIRYYLDRHLAAAVYTDRTDLCANKSV